MKEMLLHQVFLDFKKWNMEKKMSLEINKNHFRKIVDENNQFRRIYPHAFKHTLNN